MAENELPPIPPKKRTLTFKSTWETLNKPLVILALGAMGSLIYLYFNGHRECITEADKIIQRRELLRSELIGRDFAWKARMDQAKTPQEALIMPGKLGSSHADLKDASYSDLEAEFRNLSSRVRYADIPNMNIDKRRLAWLAIVEPVIDKMFDEFQASLDSKKELPANPRRSLKSSKLWAEYEFERKTFENAIDIYGYHYEPNCSTANLVAMALGYRPTIVLAGVSGMTTDSEIVKLVNDGMDEVDKAANDFRAFSEAEAKPKK